MNPLSLFSLRGALLVMLVSEIRATTVVYEDFSYAADANLNNKNGGTGFTGPWIEAGISGDYDRIQSGSLSFGALETSGRSVQSRAPGTRFTDLSRNVTDIPGTAGTNIWVSFLVRKDNAGGTPPEDYFGLVLYPSAGDALYIGDPFENDFYSLGMAGSNAGLVASSKVIIPSATGFLVAKIAFLTGADQISLYVNPTPGVEPATADAVKSDFDLTGIDALGFLAGSTSANPQWSFDELRLGTTYGDVAPVPEPTAMALLGAALFLLPGRRTRIRQSAPLRRKLRRCRVSGVLT